MNRLELQRAWVIHRRPYREGSYLVDLITERDGRITAVWRKPKRGSAGEPFQQITASWKGRGEVKSLSKVENSSPPLRLGAHALYAGFYVNELVYRLLPVADEHTNIFVAYEQCILGLASLSHFEPELRRFEYELLHTLGVWPELNSCVDTQAEVESDGSYWVSVNEGVRKSDRAFNESFTGAELVELQNNLLASENSRRLFRILVNQLLEGRSLKSRELYRDFLLGTGMP